MRQSQHASAVLRSCKCMGIQDAHSIENRYAFELNPDVVMGASTYQLSKRLRASEVDWMLTRNEYEERYLGWLCKSVKNPGLLITYFKENFLPLDVTSQPSLYT